MPSPQPETIVIVPARDEARFIGAVLRKVRFALPVADIVVVDDASNDGTGTIARELGVKVLRHAVPGGYGTAVQTGIKFALRRGYTCAATCDADGQHEPAHLERITGPCLASAADIVVGSRYLDGQFRPGWVKRAGVRFFAGVVSWVTGQRVTDPTSGFKAFSQRAMRFYAHDILPDRFPDADALIMAHRVGLRIAEAPVTMYHNEDKRSMHAGLGAVMYVFNMVFSILVTLLRHDAQAVDVSRPSDAHERPPVRARTPTQP